MDIILTSSSKNNNNKKKSRQGWVFSIVSTLITIITNCVSELAFNDKRDVFSISFMNVNSTMNRFHYLGNV